MAPSMDAVKEGPAKAPPSFTEQRRAVINGLGWLQPLIALEAALHQAEDVEKFLVDTRPQVELLRSALLEAQERLGPVKQELADLQAQVEALKEREAAIVVEHVDAVRKEHEKELTAQVAMWKQQAVDAAAAATAADERRAKAEDAAQKAEVALGVIEKRLTDRRKALEKIAQDAQRMAKEDGSG